MKINKKNKLGKITLIVTSIIQSCEICCQPYAKSHAPLPTLRNGKLKTGRDAGCIICELMGHSPLSSPISLPDELFGSDDSLSISSSDLEVLRSEETFSSWPPLVPRLSRCCWSFWLPRLVSPCCPCFPISPPPREPAWDPCPLCWPGLLGLLPILPCCLLRSSDFWFGITNVLDDKIDFEIHIPEGEKLCRQPRLHSKRIVLEKRLWFCPIVVNNLQLLLRLWNNFHGRKSLAPSLCEWWLLGGCNKRDKIKTVPTSRDSLWGIVPGTVSIKNCFSILLI